MNITFALSETLTGLRRNLTMTLAVVTTVAISLALLGAGLLIRSQVSTMKDFWYDKVEVSIFLTDAVTDAERQALREGLEAEPLVQEVFYESRADAYKHFAKQFRNSPDLVDNVRPEALPESFRVKLTDPRKFTVIAENFSATPGVDQVVDQRAILSKLFTVLNGFQFGALVVAATQLGAAIVLISNTIRVSAFTRRRETGIKRLVGASKFTIQLPFLLEGAIAGLAGSAVAIGILAAIQARFVEGTLRAQYKFTAFIGWDTFWTTAPLLLVVGVGLTCAASLLTLRKHMRV